MATGIGAVSGQPAIHRFKTNKISPSVDTKTVVVHPKKDVQYTLPRVPSDMSPSRIPSLSESQLEGAKFRFLKLLRDNVDVSGARVNTNEAQLAFIRSFDSDDAASLVAAALIIRDQQNRVSMLDRLRDAQLDTPTQRQTFFEANPDILNALITVCSSGFRAQFETGSYSHLRPGERPLFPIDNFCQPFSVWKGEIQLEEAKPKSHLNESAQKNEQLLREAITKNKFDWPTQGHFSDYQIAVANQDFGATSEAEKQEIRRLFVPILAATEPSICLYAEKITTNRGSEYDTVTSEQFYAKSAANGQGSEVDRVNHALWTEVLTHSSLASAHLERFITHLSRGTFIGTHSVELGHVVDTIIAGSRDIVSQIGSGHSVGSYVTDTRALNEMHVDNNVSLNVRDYLSRLRDLLYFSPQGGVSLSVGGNRFPHGGYLTWGSGYAPYTLSDPNSATIVIAKIRGDNPESGLDLVRLFWDASRRRLESTNTDDISGNIFSANAVGRNESAVTFIKGFHEFIQSHAALNALAASNGFDVLAAGFNKFLLTEFPSLTFIPFQVFRSGTLKETALVTNNAAAYDHNTAKTGPVVVESRGVQKKNFWFWTPKNTVVGTLNLAPNRDFETYNVGINNRWAFLMSPEISNVLTPKQLVRIADQWIDHGVDAIAGKIRDEIQSIKGDKFPATGALQVWDLMGHAMPKPKPCFSFSTTSFPSQRPVPVDTVSLRSLFSDDPFGVRAALGAGLHVNGFSTARLVDNYMVYEPTQTHRIHSLQTSGLFSFPLPLLPQIPAVLSHELRGQFGYQTFKTGKEVFKAAWAGKPVNPLNERQIDKSFSFAGRLGYLVADPGAEGNYLSIFFAPDGAGNASRIAGGFSKKVNAHAEKSFTSMGFTQKMARNYLALSYISTSDPSRTQFASINLSVSKNPILTGVGHFTVVDLASRKTIFQPKPGQGEEWIGPDTQSIKLGFDVNLNPGRQYAVIGGNEPINPTRLSDLSRRQDGTYGANEALSVLSGPAGVLIFDT